MLDHLFETYGNITAVDLEINFEHMRQAWDPQQPVDSLFKQIQDFADYFEAGGVPIGHPQQINAGYAMLNYSHSCNPPYVPVRTNPSAQRATTLRSVLARVYAVSVQNKITTTVP
jgi:hypothetical protein